MNKKGMESLALDILIILTEFEERCTYIAYTDCTSAVCIRI